MLPLSKRGHVRALQNIPKQKWRKEIWGDILKSMEIPGKNWPHAPLHWTFEEGIFMVTAGTYRKIPHLSSPDRLDFFLERLFLVSLEFGWKLQAWAVLQNHYHFIAASPEDPSNLKKFLGKLHMTTAKQLNEWDQTPGRKVWFQFWDSRISYETSYLARLNYVQNNPVKHGLIENSEQYRWCSAAWFSEHARPIFLSTVKGFKTDQIKVIDDF